MKIIVLRTRVIKAIIAHKDNNEKYRRKDSFLFRFIL